MGSVLGSIFGFGNKMKRRLRDAVSNPSDYAEMTADENRNEWRKNPDERSLGFFNPVPLGTMGNFVLRKSLEDALPSMSRREFMKKSAGLAGGTAAASIPGAKLLQKFAPEEKEIAAKAIPKEWASVEGGAHRYHSLKDYLDDVEKYVDHTSYENGVKLANKHLDSFDPINPSEYDKFVNNHMRSTRNDLTKQRLLDDEEYYKIAKGELKTINDPEWNLYYDNAATQRMKDEVNAFSPQAKQEMKALKSMHGDDWVNQIQSSEFRHYLDSSGIIQGRPQYYGDRMMPSKEFYWNGKVPIDTEYEHLNPKSGGFNFWDETGGHGLSNGTNTLEELQQAIQNYERDFL